MYNLLFINYALIRRGKRDRGNRSRTWVAIVEPEARVVVYSKNGQELMTNTAELDMRGSNQR